jgi:inhibitor of cysteine peptidase
MRRNRGGLTSGLLLLALVGGAFIAGSCSKDREKSSYPKEVQLTDSDNGSTVRLAKGGQLIVALQSNPSTGFSWYVGERAGPELELVGEPRFVPAGSTTPVVGAPGTQVFTFKASGAGTVQMVLEYKRSFEPNVPPAKTFSLTVEIK